MLSKKKKFNLLPKKWLPARRGRSCRSLNFYKRNKVQKKQTPVFQRNNWRSELKKLLVVVDFAERQRQCQVGDAERGRASREDLDRKNSLRFKTGKFLRKQSKLRVLRLILSKKNDLLCVWNELTRGPAW
jgi:hypothetical protein